MIKNITRCYSIKNIPLETKPVNLYNSKRSAYNLKPVPTQGLVHNPPASLLSPKNTPKAFLPETDPRLTILSGKFKTYTKQEVENMPLIYGMSSEKRYDVTPEIAQEILKLRNDDPEKWTIRKLARHFNISIQSANVYSGEHEARQYKIQNDLNTLKQKWNTRKINSRIDRRKRVQMWLRNEF